MGQHRVRVPSPQASCGNVRPILLGAVGARYGQLVASGESTRFAGFYLPRKAQKDECSYAAFLRRFMPAIPARPAPNSESVSGSGEGIGSAVRTVVGNAPEMEPVVETSGPV